MNLYHYEYEGRWLGGVVLVLAGTQIEAQSKATVRLETNGQADRVDTLRLIDTIPVPGPADVVYFYDGDY